MGDTKAFSSPIRARVDTLHAMTCATCKHATRPSEPAMRGWVHCALERANWHYLMPDSTCHFNPIRWEIKL